ncbi:MAG: hypothetical protein AB7V46_13665 [Thermomicrobiales bacterium]
MSRHFSIPTVLRMVPNELLQQFLTQLPEPCYCIDWEKLRERQATCLTVVFRTWPKPLQTYVETVFRHVFNLACELGQLAIREAAADLNELSRLQSGLSRGNFYQQAMWVFLEAPEVFEKALSYHEVESHSRWRKRDDLPARTPRTDAGSLNSLAERISEVLMNEQGRGRQCTVEYFQRENGTDYFCCYPDDFLRTVECHDDDGQLTTLSVRQTFLIIFAYHQATGTLEMVADVPPRLKPRLEEIFAWRILDTSIGPKTPRRVYHLDRLKDCGFQLETIPADQVHVQLKRLRFDLPQPGERIILESQKGDADAVRRMVEECLNEEEVALDQVRITAATLRFLFHKTVHRRGGSMTIDVAAPNVCNLRSLPPDRIEVALRHLRMWRIACD